MLRKTGSRQWNWHTWRPRWRLLPPPKGRRPRRKLRPPPKRWRPFSKLQQQRAGPPPQRNHGGKGRYRQARLPGRHGRRDGDCGIAGPSRSRAMNGKEPGPAAQDGANDAYHRRIAENRHGHAAGPHRTAVPPHVASGARPVAAIRQAGADGNRGRRDRTGPHHRRRTVPIR